MSENSRGFLLGAAAYTLWGVFPLYFPLLEPAGAVEILAQRIFWSLLTTVLLVVLVRRWADFRLLLADGRRVRTLAIAAVLIAVNWGTYIWGVNNEHVVETSLGYFITPLVTVLMGVGVLGERLRPVQWAALGMASIAVIGLTIEYGRLPWVALVLAASFGSYGLAKKKADAGALESLAFETLVLGPVALGYLVFLTVTASSTFTSEGVGHSALLVSTGIVTAIPLICFGAAATRVSMTTLGLLQYLAPILQFALGVLIFREPMSAMRWLGFCLVWAALAIFTVESLNHRRRSLRLAAEAAAL